MLTCEVSRTFKWPPDLAVYFPLDLHHLSDFGVGLASFVGFCLCLGGNTHTMKYHIFENYVCVIEILCFKKNVLKYFWWCMLRKTLLAYLRLVNGNR